MVHLRLPLGARIWITTTLLREKCIRSFPIRMGEMWKQRWKRQKAFPAWSALSRAERSAHLLHVADGIAAKLDELAMAESIDNGKPLWMAKRVDIPRASDNFRFFATAILHDHSELHDTDGKYLNYTLRHPIGVAGCISPWNLPLYLFTWKIAPALGRWQHGSCQAIRNYSNDRLFAQQNL
jgi:hypothetical protein